MSGIVKTYMRVSLKDFEFLENQNFLKNDLVCAIFLNGNCVDKLYLDQDSFANVSLANSADKIRFIFRSKQDGAIIGCISFFAKDLISHSGISFNQWFTLFDCPEDDDFDGLLGEDDEELPKALLSYQISTKFVSSDTYSTNPRPSLTNYQSITESGLFQEKRPSMIFHSPDLTEQTSPMRSSQGRVDTIESKDFRASAHGSCQTIPNNEDGGNRNVPETRSPMKEENKELIKLRAIKDQQPSVQKQLEILQPSSDHMDMKTLENKLTNLLDLLEKKREVDGEFRLDSEEAEQSRSDGFDSIMNKKVLNMIRSYDENQYLLYLEIERNTKLQEVLKLTESRLICIERAYQDLELKYLLGRSKAQIQNLIDKNKLLGQENQGFRDKILELEQKLEKVIEKASDEKENFAEKCNRMRDLAAIENYKARTETLEKVNHELNEENTRIKVIYKQQKEMHQNLMAQIDQSNLKFKQEFEAIKKTNDSYVDQITRLMEDLANVRQTCFDKDLEIKKMETIQGSLELELKIKGEEIENLRKEIGRYQELTQSLKSSLQGFKVDEKDITVLKQNIQLVEDKVRKEEKKNRELNEQVIHLQLELEGFKNRGYEEKIKALSKELETKEITNQSLKDIIQQYTDERKFFDSNEGAKAIIEINIEREKSAKLEEKLQIFGLERQAHAIQFQKIAKENIDLKARLEAFERENANALEKMKPLYEENQGLRASVSDLRNLLALTVSELVNQAGQVVSQKDVIKGLNEKIKVIESDLNSAFNDIRSLHLRLESKSPPQEASQIQEARDMMQVSEIKLLKGLKELRDPKEMLLPKEVVVQVKESREKEMITKKSSLEVKVERELKETRKVSSPLKSTKATKDEGKEAIISGELNKNFTRKTSSGRLEPNRLSMSKEVLASPKSKLEREAQEAHRGDKITFETIKLKNNEIDQKLKEFMKKTKIPMKFVRIGEGLYVFGSKRVHVKVIEGKLGIRIGGGYMYIEEFIRLYAHQELAKLKTMKGEISYTNIEEEELPVDVEKTQIISDAYLSEQKALKQFEQVQGKGIKVVTNSSVVAGGNAHFFSSAKGRLSERCITPDATRSSGSVTYKIMDLNRTPPKEIDASGGYESQGRESGNRKDVIRLKTLQKKTSPGSFEFSPKFNNSDDELVKLGSNKNLKQQKSIK